MSDSRMAVSTLSSDKDSGAGSRLGKVEVAFATEGRQGRHGTILAPTLMLQRTAR